MKGQIEFKEKLNREMKESLKAGDKVKLSTIRLLLAEIKNAEISKLDELSDDEMLTVINREAKRRREAIEEFGKGKRQDLVDKETEELKVLESYLPDQLENEEIVILISQAIDEVGASSIGDLGKVMNKLMPQIKGRADGKLVNQLVRETLERM